MWNRNANTNYRKQYLFIGSLGRWDVALQRPDRIATSQRFFYKKLKK